MAEKVELREVLYEFSRVGNVVRVVAVDPISNTEVIMVGSPGHSQEMLKRLARQKLAYVIAKKRGGGS
ncbi:MAG: hypothetical protein H7841_13190 [Magnetospirillum sp. WYHS-4]